MSWLVRLTPFLEQQAIHDTAIRDYQRFPVWYRPPRHSGESRRVAVIQCPAERLTGARVQPENIDIAFTHYLGVSGTHGLAKNGCLYADSAVRLADVVDGTGTTLLVGERPPSADLRFGWWYAGVGQFENGSLDSHLGVRELIGTFRAPMCPRVRQTFRPGRQADMCDTFHFYSNHPGGATSCSPTGPCGSSATPPTRCSTPWPLGPAASRPGSSDSERRNAGHVPRTAHKLASGWAAG